MIVPSAGRLLKVEGGVLLESMPLLCVVDVTHPGNPQSGSDATFRTTRRGFDTPLEAPPNWPAPRCCDDFSTGAVCLLRAVDFASNDPGTCVTITRTGAASGVEQVDHEDQRLA